ncbi:TRAP transporter substrate-binding protein [Microvirga sp. G4-2]|uniref:TRAP transporter substrate-binding protein n=1 Tax=Microvirga sp. G4-2 TaxID=3434467 RepID=UPI004043E4A1
MPGILKRLMTIAAIGTAAMVTFTSASSAQTVLKLGDIYAQTHSNSLADKRFAELVEKKTNGAVKVEVYLDSTLGNERELAESVIAGTIDIAPSGLSGIGRFVPDAQVLELPYLYRDLKHMQRVAMAIAPDVDKMFQAKGIKNLGYLFLGPRSLASRKEINTLSDMRGLRLRVPESPLYVGFARALGAVPTPIPFPEVYTSLETGVADAAEGEPATLATTKWYEPTKSVSLTKHIWHYRFFAMNGNKFNSLPQDQQKAVHEAAQEAMEYQVGLVEEFNNKALDEIKGAGVKIVETKDLDAFAKALVEFNTEFAKKLGPTAEALLQKVRTVQ